MTNRAFLMRMSKWIRLTSKNLKAEAMVWPWEIHTGTDVSHTPMKSYAVIEAACLMGSILISYVRYRAVNKVPN